MDNISVVYLNSVFCRFLTWIDVS